jgi:hypothetical protein
VRQAANFYSVTILAQYSAFPGVHGRQRSRGNSSVAMTEDVPFMIPYVNSQKRNINQILTLDDNLQLC